MWRYAHQNDGEIFLVLNFLHDMSIEVTPCAVKCEYDPVTGVLCVKINRMTDPIGSSKSGAMPCPIEPDAVCAALSLSS